jgi:hypothetical protein
VELRVGIRMLGFELVEEKTRLGGRFQ